MHLHRHKQRNTHTLNKIKVRTIARYEYTKWGTSVWLEYSICYMRHNIEHVSARESARHDKMDVT
jgi:hypothetical protein